MRYSKANDVKIPDISFANDSAKPEAELRLCEAANCREEGAFPAPKSRDNIRDYHYFCLDHVRAYNKQWNYFSGLGGAALEQAIRDASTWERPSWKFGTGGKTAPSPDDFTDVFGFFEDETASPQAARAAQLPAEERAAWAVFAIDPTDDIKQVTKRYKQLVKQHHPDRHQGDQAAEEKLKEINLAYSYLRTKLVSS